MKTILSKEGGGYDLYRIDEDGKRVTFASTQDYKQKLSLKNCQAIERGYDLDELADEYCTHEPKNAKELRDVNIVKLGFRDGFQKALEILGDKKFSASKLRVGMIQLLYLEKEKDESSEVFKERQYVFIDNYIQLLQQTEWDCIVEMEGFVDEEGIYCGERPKLDADGCLILKRK